MESYAKLHHIGKRDTAGIFDGDVEVQEKIDGSQFNFGVKDGLFWARSKHNNLPIDVFTGLFGPSVAWARSLQYRCVEGWSYRGEAIARPRHNVLTYGRAPKGNFVLWDVQEPGGRYARTGEREAIANYLGCEAVPVLFYGRTTDVHRFLGAESFLGNTTIEGVVVKNYEKGIFGKMVFDQFREMTKMPKLKTAKTDATANIGASLRTEARWLKAVQHARERGELEDSPKDIGPIIKELYRDIATEARTEIANALLEAYMKDILRQAIIGFPEWYKAQLAKDVTFPEPKEDPCALGHE